MSALQTAWLTLPDTQTLIAAFEKNGVPLRFVGGCVRDAILGLHAQDIDIATPLSPEAVIDLLQASGLRAIPTGIAYGTVTAVIDKSSFQITTLRRDIATDGRHAVVAYTDDWQEDAKRRDFTMNALYLSPSGELFDYFDGVADAKAGHVRFIGNPVARITEDYLRILRFFRFFARFGIGEPNAEAIQACANLASHIISLSAERIGDEMTKLLSAPRASDALHHMYWQNILLPVLGFGVDDQGVISCLNILAQETASHVQPGTRLAALLILAKKDTPQHCKALRQRLRLNNDSDRQIQLILQYHKDLTETLSQSEQKKLIRALGRETYTQILLIRLAQAPKSKAYREMLTLARDWQLPHFPLTGEDIKSHGIAEGKAIGKCLQKLEILWEDSNYTLTREALLARITSQ